MRISAWSSDVCSSDLLGHLDLDFVDRQTLQIGQAHLRIQLLARRRKAALGQAALHRHLAAFEADFVEAARAGFLALVATPGRLAQAGADAAPDTTPGALADRKSTRLNSSH